MTSAKLISRLGQYFDTVLDSDTFPTTTEAYNALSEAQTAVAVALLDVTLKKRRAGLTTPLPKLLTVLFNETSSTTTTGEVTFPANFMHLDSAGYGASSDTLKPCNIFYADDSYKIKDNTYLKGSLANPSVVYRGTDLHFSPVPSGTYNYEIQYLDYPTDISVGTNPQLGDEATVAILLHAYSELLLKDERTEESMAARAQYEKEIQRLTE